MVVLQVRNCAKLYINFLFLDYNKIQQQMRTKRNKENFNYSCRLASLLDTPLQNQFQVGLSKCLSQNVKQNSPIKKLDFFDEDKVLSPVKQNQPSPVKQNQSKQSSPDKKTTRIRAQSHESKTRTAEQIFQDISVEMKGQKKRSSGKRQFHFQMQNISAMGSQIKLLLDRTRASSHNKAERQTENLELYFQQEKGQKTKVDNKEIIESIPGRETKWQDFRLNLQRIKTNEEEPEYMQSFERILGSQNAVKCEQTGFAQKQIPEYSFKLNHTQIMDTEIKKIRQRINFSAEKTKKMEQKYLGLKSKGQEEPIKNPIRFRMVDRKDKQAEANQQYRQKSARRKNIAKRAEQINRLQREEEQKKEKNRISQYFTFISGQRNRYPVETKNYQINSQPKIVIQSDKAKNKREEKYRTHQRSYSQTKKERIPQNQPHQKNSHGMKKDICEKNKLIKDKILGKIACRLSQLVEMDRRLGEVRVRFSKLDDYDKWKKLKDSLKKYGFDFQQRELHQNLKIESNEINPFEGSASTHGDCIGSLAHLFQQAQNFWRDGLTGTLESRQKNSWSQIGLDIDLNKSGGITLPDLVCFVNVHCNKFLRNRDLFYTFNRFKSSRNLKSGVQYQSFLDKFC